MTMVERVANAISLSFREEGYVEGVSDPSEWREFLQAARAAIEAMHIPEDHEPMDRVVEAAQTEVDIWPEDKPKPSPNFVQFVSREEAIAIWNAGIDAALSEGDGA